jgi:STE24 endopeptidase
MGRSARRSHPLVVRPLMQFVLILAVLAALVVSEYGPSEPVSGGLARLTIAAVGVALPALFALLASGVIARRLRADFSRHRSLLRRFHQLRAIHAVLWLLCIGGIICGLHWGQIVRFNWHLDRVPLVDELLILGPVLVPLVFSWAAFYEVDKAVHVGLADQGVAAPPFPTRREYIGLHFRLHLGILLVPLLGLLGVQDAAQLIVPDAVQCGQAAPVFLPSLAALFVLLPVVLRYVWQTRPLPAGPLRSRLEGAAGRAGFRAREILVWHTHGMVVNAAVAGLVRRLRYVFLTDALLQRLDDDEIEAVFGHEMGHVRHHHLLLRVMAMVAPLSFCMLLGQAFPDSFQGLQEGPSPEWLALGEFGLSIPTGLVLLGLMAVYVVVVFGHYSRQLEHQADLFGCRWMTPEAQRTGLERFTSALEKLALTGGAARDARTWQHASIARRIDFLSQLSRDPKRELRFQRRVRLLGSVLIGIVLSPLAYRLLLG